jgi:hypothetical protein
MTCEQRIICYIIFFTWTRHNFLPLSREAYSVYAIWLASSSCVLVRNGMCISNKLKQHTLCRPLGKIHNAGKILILIETLKLIVGVLYHRTSLSPGREHDVLPVRVLTGVLSPPHLESWPWHCQSWPPCCQWCRFTSCWGRLFRRQRGP